MAEDALPAVSHVSLGTNNLDRAAVFYDRVLAPLGIRRIEAFPGAIGYGRRFPEFWIQVPVDGRPAAVGNGTHVGFFAADRAGVEAFHAAGLAAGGTCEGPPGKRPHDGDSYFGAFLRDPDGHKVEAMCWEAPPPG
jgi:catechol 2,3-dioxygenase-like lactoylglutathione lyase family enzyme